MTSPPPLQNKDLKLYSKSLPFFKEEAIISEIIPTKSEVGPERAVRSSMLEDIIWHINNPTRIDYDQQEIQRGQQQNKISMRCKWGSTTLDLI